MPFILTHKSLVMGDRKKFCRGASIIIIIIIIIIINEND